MLIVTNRNINEKNLNNGVGDHNAFGEEMNAKGPQEIRLAYANKKSGSWRVELVKEAKQLTDGNLPSKREFGKLRNRLAKDGTNCVFFVHGFNQSLKKNLDKALELEEEHGVEVVAFSWPSNPGGFKTKEYRRAKRAAKASVAALDATMEKLSRYLTVPFNRKALAACDTKFSFISHSLGNLLFQHYVTDAVYEDETGMFDNVILCQADVDNKRHNDWVEEISVGKRVYVTINENDWVLKWSDANFQKDRLGRTVRDLKASNASYFDFTDGPNVGRTHGMFYKKTNDSVKTFFTSVLNGQRGENTEGLEYNQHTNAYVHSRRED